MDNLLLRKARSEDSEAVFTLSNEDYVRKYSLNKEKITWEEHIRWYSNILQDNNQVFYIISDINGQFLGQIRYRIENKCAIVSISLSYFIMGRGLSKQLLLESIDALYQEKNEVKEIIAYVSEDNVASNKLFAKAGFCIHDKQKDLNKYIFGRE